MSNPFADISAQRRKDIEREIFECVGILAQMGYDWRAERAVGGYGTH